MGILDLQSTTNYLSKKGNYMDNEIIVLNVSDVASLLKMYEKNSFLDWVPETSGVRMQMASDILESLEAEKSACYKGSMDYEVSPEIESWIKNWAEAQNFIEVTRVLLSPEDQTISEEAQEKLWELQKRVNEGDTVKDIVDDIKALTGRN